MNNHKFPYNWTLKDTVFTKDKANKRQRLKAFDFKDFRPRKGVICSEYFNPPPGIN